MTEDGLLPPESAEAVNTKKPSRGAAIVGGLLVGLMVIWIVSAVRSDDGAQNATDQRYGAFTVCKDFVEDRLKAPATAKFRNFFQDDGEVRVSDSGDGTFVVTSTVDSQNGFGALVRTGFICIVATEDGERFRLVDLALDE